MPNLPTNAEARNRVLAYLDAADRTRPGPELTDVIWTLDGIELRRSDLRAILCTDQPTRWWRLVTAERHLLAESSDVSELCDFQRTEPGSRIERLYETEQTREWHPVHGTAN